MDENEAALRAGTVDAVHVFQPYAERLVASGAGHVWYAAATRGLTAYTTLVTRRGVLEQRQDDLLKMARAVYRTLGWFAATPAALYSDVIRERWRRPRFRGELPDATAVAEDVNPLCGDRVRLMLRVADGQVAAARFVGDSCAICTASADVVAE